MILKSREITVSIHWNRIGLTNRFSKSTAARQRTILKRKTAWIACKCRNKSKVAEATNKLIFIQHLSSLKSVKLEWNSEQALKQELCLTNKTFLISHALQTQTDNISRNVVFGTLNTAKHIRNKSSWTIEWNKIKPFFNCNLLSFTKTRNKILMKISFVLSVLLAGLEKKSFV